MTHGRGVPIDLLLRQALHLSAPTQWRHICWWVVKRIVDAVSYGVFFVTVVPKIWLFLYAGYPVIWLLGLGYITAKTLGMFFDMPWWFELIDCIASVATLPSRIVEATGIIPVEPAPRNRYG